MDLLDSFHLYGSISTCSKPLLQLIVGAPGDPAAVGVPVSDQAKSLVEAVFDGNQ